MGNKPITIFASLMTIAVVVIVGYLILSNPYHSKTSTTTAKAQMGDQDAMILFLHNCASCHGPAGTGLNGNPSLKNIGLSEMQIATIIRNGRGRMPGIKNLSQEQALKIARFVKRF